MAGPVPIAFAMAATPFQTDGALDEEGLRRHLERLTQSGCGVYLGSGGSGEGHALSLEEISRVYEIGVDVCKGRVPVCANPPEPRTAKGMIQVATAAARAGVDLVQVYLLDPGHGMRPTPLELEFYLRTVLDALDHPTALSVHFYAGYLPSTAMLVQLCRDYPQVKALNAIGCPFSYLVELMDGLGPGIDIYVGVKQILEALPLGARGYMAAEPNIAPYLCRSIVEHYARGDMSAFAEATADMFRLATIVNRWSPANARWIKMAMKVLALPGGNGVLRPPYLLPPQGQLDEMARALTQFEFEKIEAAAKKVCEMSA